MKILFLVACLLACIISGAAHAEPFITFDNPGLTREERIIKHQVEKYTNSPQSIQSSGESIQTVNYFTDQGAMCKDCRRNLSDAHQYIFKDKESVSDRAYALLVQKLDKKNEHYSGR